MTMTLQDDFEAGAREYAKHLEEREARERREALALEARDHANGSAFAQAIEGLFTQHDTEHHADTTQEI